MQVLEAQYKFRYNHACTVTTYELLECLPMDLALNTLVYGTLVFET